jgi:hypothetical protein
MESATKEKPLTRSKQNPEELNFRKSFSSNSKEEFHTYRIARVSKITRILSHKLEEMNRHCCMCKPSTESTVFISCKPCK